MTAQDDHLAQVQRNLAMLEHLLANADSLGPGALQWAVIVAFYAAVHCVEAHFRSIGLPLSVHHRERNERLRAAGVPYAVVDSYKQLREWSEQARYLLGSFDADFVQNVVVLELRVVLEFVGLSY
ncbi:MAG TPA: hypothetical protein VGJ60_37355 [Chloroflexota bacterium]